MWGKPLTRIQDVEKEYEIESKIIGKVFNLKQDM